MEINSANEIQPSNLTATPIMDYERPLCRQTIATLKNENSNKSKKVFLQNAYHHIQKTVKPIYTLDEFQPASKTLEKKQGSCSQRTACLETIARGNGIPTRVRALWVDGKFWYPRFSLVSRFIPKRVLLAWPQFNLDGTWIDFDELFAETSEMVKQTKSGFANNGETLFEAIAHTTVDFLGKSKKCMGFCDPTQFDLSKFVISDEGFFDTRDELYSKHYSLHRSWQGKMFTLVYGSKKSYEA